MAQEYIVLVAGPMGAGKTTAISALSEIPVIKTEALNTDLARNAKALTLLDHLLQQPTVSIKRVALTLGCTPPTAAKLVADFESRGWLRELTGYGRNRLWRYQPYVDLFHRDTIDALIDDSAPAAITAAGSATK